MWVTGGSSWTIEATSGCVLSTCTTGAATGTGAALPSGSLSPDELLSDRFRFPSPVPVPTVSVYVLADTGVSPVICAPETVGSVVRVKFPTLSPTTGSRNVIV